MQMVGQDAKNENQDSKQRWTSIGSFESFPVQLFHCCGPYWRFVMGSTMHACTQTRMGYGLVVYNGTNDKW